MSYLYRVQITSFPEGALDVWEDGSGDSFDAFDPNWAPPGWAPDASYVERFGTDRFIWPTTNKTWKSRSSAMERKKLLESYGATAIVQRSSPILWPRDGEESVRPEDQVSREAFVSLVKKVLDASTGGKS